MYQVQQSTRNMIVSYTCIAWNEHWMQISNQETRTYRQTV